jgi:hypothetical protein
MVMNLWKLCRQSLFHFLSISERASGADASCGDEKAPASGAFYQWAVLGSNQ